MIQYDLVPIRPEQASKLVQMLHSEEFILFRRCAMSAMHSKLIDAANLKIEASAKSTENEASKKLAQAGMSESEAKTLGTFIHVLDYMADVKEFSTIIVKPS